MVKSNVEESLIICLQCSRQLSCPVESIVSKPNYAELKSKLYIREV